MKLGYTNKEASVIQLWQEPGARIMITYKIIGFISLVLETNEMCVVSLRKTRNGEQDNWFSKYRLSNCEANLWGFLQKQQSQ